jgi:hypothetical protein
MEDLYRCLFHDKDLHPLTMKMLRATKKLLEEAYWSSVSIIAQALLKSTSGELSYQECVSLTTLTGEGQ